MELNVFFLYEKITYVVSLPHVFVAIVLALIFTRHDEVHIDVKIRLIIFALHCSTIGDLMKRHLKAK